MQASREVGMPPVVGQGRDARDVRRPQARPGQAAGVAAAPAVLLRGQAARGRRQVVPHVGLDLCCGLGGASSAWRDRGWDVTTLDADPRFDADVTADVRTWKYDGPRP